MNHALQWIKSNVVIVICLLVILLSIGSLFWPTAGVAQSFREEIDRRAATKQEAQSYIDRSVSVPSPVPGQPPQSVRMTVNENDVAELQRIFGDMTQSFGSLEQAVINFNRYGPNRTNPHEVLVDGLFPKPQTGAKLIDARDAYKRKLVALYRTLNAGLPPTDADIQRLHTSIAATQAEFIGGNASNDPALLEKQAKQTVELLVNRARSIRIYCPPTVIDERQQFYPGVFDVGTWATEASRPTLLQVWEGQMNYWIQQDIIAAIRLANFDPSVTSVLRLPVKRIIGITVDPKYIGLTPRGGEATTGGMSYGSDYGAEYGAGYSAGGGADTGAVPANTSTPAPPDDLSQPLKRDFRLSLTGRRSNSLYDVRHATVILHVDSEQLPKLLNAFGQVNLMTPIIRRITRVDQAQQISQGFVYGNGIDVVEVELLVESLWLRDWTAGHATQEEADAQGETLNPGLMPDPVRYRLSLPTRDPNYRPSPEEGTNDQFQGSGPSGGTGGYGGPGYGGPGYGGPGYGPEYGGPGGPPDY